MGDDMPQGLHSEGLDLLAGLHRPHDEGRVQAVIYHHPGDAPYAMQLAAIIGVPAQCEPDAPCQRAAPPAAHART
jgi:hypothetical protein